LSKKKKYHCFIWHKPPQQQLGPGSPIACCMVRSPWWRPSERQKTSVPCRVVLFCCFVSFLLSVFVSLSPRRQRTCVPSLLLYPERDARTVACLCKKAMSRPAEAASVYSCRRTVSIVGTWVSTYPPT